MAEETHAARSDVFAKGGNGQFHTQLLAPMGIMFKRIQADDAVRTAMVLRVGHLVIGDLPKADLQQIRRFLPNS